jgi:hypothetical protein
MGIVWWVQVVLVMAIVIQSRQTTLLLPFYGIIIKINGLTEKHRIPCIHLKMSKKEKERKKRRCKASNSG